MKKNPYFKDEQKYFLNTFKRQPLLLVKAKDSTVWDAKGKSYLDFYSGIAVCGVGHNHPAIVKAIKKQADKLLHSSNYFYTEPQMKLAKAITAKYNGSKVFFSNSGAEANEAAIKLARLWATQHNKPGRDILTFENAFHGRTLATSTASWGNSRNNHFFEPLPKGFRSVPYNDLDALKKSVDDNTIAVLLEPIQGEGGINIASPEFLAGVAALCKERNLLLILDEVQSGLGRTGKFFAFEHANLKPDIVTLAKGLAGGLPLGATLAQPNVAEFMVPGLHGSTFGGNPVACAAALEVLKRVDSRALIGIRKFGKKLHNILQEFARYPGVKQIRTFGLMAAIELDHPGDDYVSAARERGLLINCTHTSVLRFLPPYFMSDSDLNRAILILHSVFKNLSSHGNDVHYRR
jgi:predicted acetylornithine/succinylornithine family transaminase